MAPEEACERKLQADEIVVRLRSDGPRGSQADRTLGQAFVNAEGGQYATVFVPSVCMRASNLRLTFELLMGYAVAHEAGHCLLGLGHAYAGLMRAEWNRKDAEEMSRLSLNFTRQEARKIAARLIEAQPPRA